jgi:YD repeat-containing protein
MRLRLLVQAGSSATVDTVQFTPDPVTRQLKEVRDFGRGTTSLAYNSNGMLQKVTLPTGQVRWQSYLANRQLAEILYASNEPLC